MGKGTRARTPAAQPAQDVAFPLYDQVKAVSAPCVLVCTGAAGVQFEG